MAYRTRVKYTSAQKQEIWDRWKKGESLNWTNNSDAMCGLDSMKTETSV